MYVCTYERTGVCNMCMYMGIYMYISVCKDVLIIRVNRFRFITLLNNLLCYGMTS
jgi:hypothetical protein